MIARCGCGAVWHQAGNRTAHCAACHRTFATEAAWEAHRFWPRGADKRMCLDPATMPRMSSRLDPQGHPVWHLAPTAGQVAGLERLRERREASQ